MPTYTFHVTGTHCASCKILIEDMLNGDAGVSRVSVDLAHETVTVDTALPEDPAALATRWSTLLEPHHYRLSMEKMAQATHGLPTALAFPIGLGILGGFLFLQRSGILNIGFGGEVTPWVALGIGVVASLSSCLAVVGGLILSLSATIAQDVPVVRPFLFFHVGRLSGFTLLGGLLGFLGGALAVDPHITAGLGILASLVMVVLGINLLGLHLAKRFQFTLPAKTFRMLTNIENGYFAPLLLGIGTFFLPCGFTQSMQVAALSSGSFSGGMMIMSFFALGTLPVLLALSFGSFRFAHTRFAPLFFKTAGVVVIGLGTLSLLAGLAGIGLISPLFTF
jgi:sulfite exporter TauE/SafE